MVEQAVCVHETVAALAQHDEVRSSNILLECLEGHC